MSIIASMFVLLPWSMFGNTARTKPKRPSLAAQSVPVMKLTGVFIFLFFSNSKSFMIFCVNAVNVYMYLVSSQSIPFWDKFVFVATTSWRLMAHVFDMARDIILIVFLKFAKRGAHYIFHWVSYQ